MAGLTIAPSDRPPAGLPAALSSVHRTLVMGILNVTPDSFSDGGRYLDPGAAVDHAEQMVRAGADIIDVGGESTRPGAARVDPATERDRVLPVIAGIAELGVPVSVDTMRASTAAAAVAAGAVVVNDVSGGLADPDMLSAMAGLGVPYVIMHWRGHSDRMGAMTDYGDVVHDVRGHLFQRVQAAVGAGVAGDRIVIDPGLGFAKQHEHNWSLLGALADLPGGFPVLVGASRKRFLGALLAGSAGDPRPVGCREAASAAVATLAAAAGVWCVRVHDVGASADAVRVVAAWRAAQGRHGQAARDPAGSNRVASSDATQEARG